MEYERLWDVSGIILALTMVASWIAAFWGVHPVITVDGGNIIPISLAHIIGIAIGFALTEKGFVKVYTKTIKAFS